MSDPSRPPGPGWVGHDKGGPPFPAVDVVKPNWSRRRRWSTLLGVVVVIGVIVAAVVVYQRVTHKQSRSEFVAAYLDALAHGSAADVLSYGNTPDDPAFLTDAVLHAQQQLAPITDVHTASSGDFTVDASYQFGSQTVDATFDLSGTAGHWKLPQTWVDVTFRDAPADATLFGQPIGTRGAVPVFPGPLVLGSLTGYLSVQSTGTFVGWPDDVHYDTVDLDVAVTPAGRAAAVRAVAAEVAACVKVQELSPERCPQHLYPNLKPSENLVSQSIHWTAPTTLADLQYSLDGAGLEVSGDAYFSVSYDVESTVGGTQTRSTKVLTDLAGTVDLTTVPPTYLH